MALIIDGVVIQTCGRRLIAVASPLLDKTVHPLTIYCKKTDKNSSALNLKKSLCAVDVVLLVLLLTLEMSSVIIEIVDINQGI